MTLLTELISVQRIEEPGDETPAKEAGRDFYEPPLRDREDKRCPFCDCEPCECIGGERDEKGLDDMSDDMGKLDDPRGDVENEEGTDAHEEGYRAFLDGVRLEDNPYQLDAKGASWDSGWHAAEEHAQEEQNNQQWTQDQSDADVWGQENEESSYCVDCGSPVPAGQRVCSMCYGDIGYGRDGHYHDWAERQQREEERQQEDNEDASAYDLGYNAFMQGRGLDSNPFEFGTTDYQEWVLAFKDARQEAQSEEKNWSSWSQEDEGVDATAEGEKAFHSGEDIDDNPYAPRSRAYEQWAHGWSRASRGEGQRHGHYDYEDNEQTDRLFKFTWKNGKSNQGYGRDMTDALRRMGLGASMTELKSFEDITPQENEESQERGLGAYGQQGAHMGGAKETPQDDLAVDPDSADNLDLGDEQQDQDAEGDDQKLDALTDKASEDPDRQGVVRKVKGAHLVYKRQGPDGTYEELWIYNTGNMRDELSIRKAILAGTDIPTTKTTSPDGGQQYELWSMGNAEVLQIKGLPN